ncbi:RNA polymerase sigma factor [Candidatus Uhrbacteria bacterium]|nr:RNA polymerase sigma factor [Candidatus Uhrbacteria bacterium]
MHKHDFEQFYKLNLDRIFRYVYFRVGQNRSVCEDLVSEIFTKALEHFNSFDPAISRSAWIYRIAHNHLANYFRDKKPVVDIEEVSIVAKTKDQTEIQEALGHLSKEDRKIVTMKYLEGYNYQEIGEILGKTAGSVKMAAHRALKLLKQKYVDTN